ncbi:hypothetical protein [Amaricoccus tamworthensis]|uniref:hypothetical protein n=1 Tax=Amaricoccus tamworthensis TaxID=57002 RepID=UPI003C7B0277
MARTKFQTTRRDLLALFAGGVATAISGPALAHAPSDTLPAETPDAGLKEPRILFVGNSITRRHDVPSRVAALAEKAGARVRIGMAARDGARLRETIMSEHLTMMLDRAHWDVLVLQDHTTTPFRTDDRRLSRETMTRLASMAEPERVLLYPPWPRAAGHPFYSRIHYGFDLTPQNPREFANRTMEFYEKVSQEYGFTVAPVPARWLAAVESGHPVYDTDDYHASSEGAELAAGVLWDCLSDMLGADLSTPHQA